ncbi:MAG TPA: hypothetical protein VFR80_00360 [Pyrinomonadaceae bacterium]|nr:hypothetical protein [Pyrinomonadaceae bacterium]
MQNLSPTPTFERGAVQPMVCLRAGYDLIKDQYWLFVGMCFVAILIGSVVPFGILMGPMMCGLYLAIFQKHLGQRVEFGLLFKGFDYLAESIIATLIHVVPIVVIIVPFYIAFYGALFFMMPRNGDPDPGAFIAFLGVFFVFLIVVMILIMLISVLFTFTYPLIVDRRLGGIDAVRTSAKAALANFWPLLGLLLLTGLLGFCGVLLCYVGMFLVFPVTFAAMSMAYKQVFGIKGAAPVVAGPPPPPTFT